MNSRRSNIIWGLVLAGSVAAMLMFSASDWWQHAIDPNDMIEIIIHNDREYFRKLQPVWDEMEAKNPGWVRPKATTEEEYQRWRKQHSKVDDDWQTIQPLEPVNASAPESADSANKISDDSQQVDGDQ